MSKNDIYEDLRGRAISLADLDADERDLVEQLRRDAEQHPDWRSGEYSNLWMKKVASFYEARGLNRRQIVETPVFRIAQDLDSRLGIASGAMRRADYRDELEKLIHAQFKTRREFCQATGLSEDMLSHVLAKRKHLAIDTLADALQRIGYTIHIAPSADAGA